MTPMEWLALAEGSFALFQKIRAGATAAGVSDQDLDNITLDYDQRIAKRQADAQPTSDQ